jgi:hypothetical protein
LILVEQELLRARWRRTLAELGLDRTSRDDFGMGGLAGRLHSVTVQLVLLPADPEGDVIAFDERFTSWLGDQRRFDLDGLILDLPHNTMRTCMPSHSLTGTAGIRGAPTTASTGPAFWSSGLGGLQGGGLATATRSKAVSSV